MSSSLAPTDARLDSQLATLAESFRFLLDLTPTNAAEAKQRWLTGDRAEPAFEYRELSTDPDVAKASLEQIDPGEAEDPTVESLLRGKKRELELQVEMLRARHSDDFLPLSLEAYGGVNDDLRTIASKLFEEVEPFEDSVQSLSAGEFHALAEEEIAWYQSQNPDVTMHAEVREDVSGVLVSGDTLLISAGSKVPPYRAKGLLQHEVGTHLVTQVNGSAQDLTLLGAGLAGYDETQEGLAVLAEFVVGEMTTTRIRQLASRVLVVDRMVKGESFEDCWQFLADHGVSEGSAFMTVMRIFRAGGLTKDACYLRGLLDLIAHVKGGGELDLLFTGKFALQDLGLVEQLQASGLLAPLAVQSRWTVEGDVNERLRALASTPLTEVIVAG